MPKITRRQFMKSAAAIGAVSAVGFPNIVRGQTECVRCSACVQSCPTGVLQFGEVNRKTGEVIRRDRLAASPVLMAELTVNGRSVS